MRLVIVSAGNVSRNVIGRLGDRWEITLIDPSEDSLEMARQIRQVETVQGGRIEPAGAAPGRIGGSRGADSRQPG